jgi:hypothetical protein
LFFALFSPSSEPEWPTMVAAERTGDQSGSRRSRPNTGWTTMTEHRERWSADRLVHKRVEASPCLNR